MDDVRMMLLEAGYEEIRPGSFRKGGSRAVISGYVVFVRRDNMWRPFLHDRAVRLGVEMMERLSAMRPQERTGREDRTNYDICQRFV
jgi:hypothetical protein